MVERGRLGLAETLHQRFSLAINEEDLDERGVPLDFIAKLGGWKKLEVLKNYLLSSGLDVAKVVAEYDFF